MRTIIAILATALALTACGGSDDQSDSRNKDSGDPTRCAPGQVNCK